ncbi:hypothetical protein [Streptomyces sp900116325]|uniref:hypothetical protein n=1 Tax=Streptomyces sp. 900116325 TaxID=3154295 RepID=UPI0033D97ACB
MNTPIVVYRSAPTGDRAVTINDEVVGVVHDDHELIEPLRRAGIYDAEHCLDDRDWVEWRDRPAHRYEPAWWPLPGGIYPNR